MNFELRVVSPEKYDQFLAAKKAGKSTQEALEAIGEDAVRRRRPCRSTRGGTRATSTRPAPRPAREAEGPGMKTEWRIFLHHRGVPLRRRRSSTPPGPTAQSRPASSGSARWRCCCPSCSARCAAASSGSSPAASTCGPEDRPDGEIADGAGEIGFFSPGSYWPFGLALAAAIAGLGLVVLAVLADRRRPGGGHLRRLRPALRVLLRHPAHRRALTGRPVRPPTPSDPGPVPLARSHQIGQGGGPRGHLPGAVPNRRIGRRILRVVPQDPPPIDRLSSSGPVGSADGRSRCLGECQAPAPSVLRGAGVSVGLCARARRAGGWSRVRRSGTGAAAGCRDSGRVSGVPAGWACSVGSVCCAGCCGRRVRTLVERGVRGWRACGGRAAWRSPAACRSGAGAVHAGVVEDRLLGGGRRARQAWADRGRLRGASAPPVRAGLSFRTDWVARSLPSRLAARPGASLPTAGSDQVGAAGGPQVGWRGVAGAAAHATRLVPGPARARRRPPRLGV